MAVVEVLVVFLVLVDVFVVVFLVLVVEVFPVLVVVVFPVLEDVFVEADCRFLRCELCGQAPPEDVAQESELAAGAVVKIARPTFPVAEPSEARVPRRRDP